MTKESSPPAPSQKATRVINTASARNLTLKV